MNCLKKLTLLLVLCLTIQSAVYPQEKSTKKEKTTSQQTRHPKYHLRRSGLRLHSDSAEDTPVASSSLQNYASSSDATVNEKVDFEVPRRRSRRRDCHSTWRHAYRDHTEAQPKRRMGRAGKLNLNIDYIQLADGEKVSLRAVKGGSGGNHTAAMTGAIVATSIPSLSGGAILSLHARQRHYTPRELRLPHTSRRTLRLIRQRQV